MAYFVLGDEPESYVSPSISDNFDKALDDLHVTGAVAERVKEIGLRVLRKTFYDSSQEERLYLSKLSRTYTLLFVLKNEPKIVEYFRNMSAEFILYVGADILIRMLSEHYLDEDDRMMSITLGILSAAGSTLVLSEKCLEEVWTHIKATDWEFKESLHGD